MKAWTSTFLVMAARGQWQISFARLGAPPRAQPSPEAQAARQAALKAFYEKYPPTTPMIVGNIEEVRIDDKDHELYCTDSYLGGRIMVFRPRHACLQAGLGRLRPQTVANVNGQQGQGIHPRRAGAEGVPEPPDAEHFERRAGLRRRFEGRTAFRCSPKTACS